MDIASFPTIGYIVCGLFNVLEKNFTGVPFWLSVTELVTLIAYTSTKNFGPHLWASMLRFPDLSLFFQKLLQSFSSLDWVTLFPAFLNLSLLLSLSFSSLDLFSLSLAFLNLSTCLLFSFSMADCLLVAIAFLIRSRWWHLDTHIAQLFLHDYWQKSWFPVRMYDVWGSKSGR